MPSALVRDLIECGVHFGHRTSRWNPKMQPYIYGRRNTIHIIDIRETVRGLLLAKKFITSVVSGGQDVLFVGTKRQAREAVKQQAERCGMPYVSERWLGGTLTNFRTIRSRLARMEELEALETSGAIRQYSKKMVSALNREKRRIHRNLEGIRKMTRLPGTLFVVDVRHEHIALKEARKIGIPTVCLIDTDGDPTWADVAIPGNDDAMRAIHLLLGHIADAVQEGKRSRPSEAPAAREAERAIGPRAASDERVPRRSRRLTATQRAEQMLAEQTPQAVPVDAGGAEVAAAAEPGPDPSEPAGAAGPDQHSDDSSPASNEGAVASPPQSSESVAGVSG